MPNYQGPERRRGQRHDAVSDAVAPIAAYAVHEAMLTYRRRILRNVTFTVISVLLALGGGLLWVHSANQANARYNCREVQHVAHVLGAFVRTDAVDRKGGLTTQERAQVDKAFGKLLTPGVLQHLERQQQQLDSRTINYWRGYVLSGLEGVAAPSCHLI